jgi:multimeric flavodoxin WrbA
MKKVVGISFSPRKLGNSEIAIKELVNNIPEDIDFEFIQINKYNIKQCIACYKCLFEGSKCKLDDDFYEVFNKILDADGLIFAVPSYFLGPNSSFKVFIDRFLISYNFYEKLYLKPVILISLAGVKPSGEGYLDLALKTTARALNLDVKGSAILYGALPGEVLLDDENKDTLKKLGKNLFGEDSQSFSKEQGNICTICGSNYFEFLENNFVKCIVCKNKGKIVIEDNSVNVYMEQTGESFYGTTEANQKHRKWLMNMKERFIAERKKLKEITKKYL